jgi:UDP-N-acetylglucosamine 2-epimerase (non-hydrolysing)
MKICFVLGTRPEIIKLSPIIRECQQRGLEYFMLHTGQHYSYNMDRAFFEELNLPPSKYNLDIGSGSHAQQTGKMLIGIESVLQNEKPNIVLVEGDTNTVLAGALAAVKLGVKVGHVEAGLRSYDREMPEETNRILADHCSDLLFAPTKTSRDTLLREGISRDRIYVTGNTVVDAVLQNLEFAKKRTRDLRNLKITEDSYFLATVHRQENVDNKNRFERILAGLNFLIKKFGFPVIYPIHPRARKQLETFGLDAKEVRLTDPVSYLTFLNLENSSRLVLTDSGGVQEETCILKVPCVTLRDNTERPETLEVGSNMLAGTNSHSIVDKTDIMLKRKRNWKNPFGDGKAAKRIARIVSDRYEKASIPHLGKEKRKPAHS